ncbi:MAG: PaaI family thioesterase [Gracilibacteraceae bacterium]|jgi:acyl-coenzyme A thioesterase PaaI-like protein|nr:PaaI family thioesterase [Gracilibacteraceae bacterium]
MDKAFFEKRKKDFVNGPIEYLNLAGIIPEIIEERHVRFVLPLSKIHLNHVGIAYAGSMFVFAEATGANLFVAVYGQDKFAPIIKGVEVKYLKPCKTDMIIDLTISEEEAAAKIKPIEERGRGDYFLDVPIQNTDGEIVAEFKINYYAIKPTKNFGS